MSNTPPSNVENPTALPTRLTCEGVPFEVWIAVDGNEAPHYAKEYDETKKEVTCWIESEAGKPFSIGYKSITDEYAMGMQVYLDGCQSADFILRPDYKNHEWQMSSVRTSQFEGQRLTFGLLELTDDDTYLNQSLKSENFGEIRLVVDKKASYTQCTRDSVTYRLPGTQKVHERSKKGLNHQIKAGPSEPMLKVTTFTSQTAGVVVTFIFRYRTRAMLQANGVIAPAPTPPVLREQSETANNSPTAKRALSEEQSDNDQDGMSEREKALLAELQEIRRNKRTKDSGGGTRKKVKVESNTSKLHFKRGEVIDLTDDAPKANAKAQRKSREMKKEIVDLTL